MELFGYNLCCTWQTKRRGI